MNLLLQTYSIYNKWFKRKAAARTEMPVVIVTGCASGIGFEIVKELSLRPDIIVVATARSKSINVLKREFSESCRFIIRELDVTDNDNISALIDEIMAQFKRVDVIINNAAVCFRAVIEHMDFESELLQLKTNYLGPLALIRAALPIMREQRSGSILNISSVSGMLAMPTMGSYSASKHALEGATEALWYESRPFGINVNLVQLGFIHSDSFKRVVLSRKAEMSKKLDGPHSEYYSSMTPMIEKLMAFSPSSSTKVAKRIVQLIDRPTSQLRLPLTPDAVIFGVMKKIIPSFIFNRFLYLLLPGSLKWGGQWRVGGAALTAVENSASEKTDKAA
jgi:NAD(P)-dependent dehydrogenase (short-subunit alcohol dehydrogenase family)